MAHSAVLDLPRAEAWAFSRGLRVCSVLPESRCHSRAQQVRCSLGLLHVRELVFSSTCWERGRISLPADIAVSQGSRAGPVLEAFLCSCLPIPVRALEGRV